MQDLQQAYQADAAKGIYHDPSTQLSALSGQLNNIPQAQTFKAPDPNQVASTPEAQFAMSQGVQALDRSAAAKGGFGSGGALQELMQYGQGLASTQYNNAFTHALQGAQFNQQGLQQQYQNVLSGFGALSNSIHGQNALNLQQSTANMNMGFQQQQYADQRQDMANANAGASQAYNQSSLQQQMDSMNGPNPVSLIGNNSGTPSSYQYGYTPSSGWSSSDSSIAGYFGGE
jgi:hypothetical protein